MCSRAFDGGASIVEMLTGDAEQGRQADVSTAAVSAGFVLPSEEIAAKAHPREGEENHDLPPLRRTEW